MKDTPAALLLRNARRRAARKGLPFSLTRAWVQMKLNAGYCEVTDLPFYTGTGASHPDAAHPRRPSIDRIDSSRGYTPGNCQMVVWQYNAAKGQWDNCWLDEMIDALKG